MSEPKSYIRVDAHGVYRVGDTHVMLDSVAVAFQQGHSPETIRQRFPSLSLEAVYGAITYYLGHAAEMAAYFERQDAEWEKAQQLAEGNPGPVVERLRAVCKAKALT